MDTPVTVSQFACESRAVAECGSEDAMKLGARRIAGPAFEGLLDLGCGSGGELQGVGSSESQEDEIARFLRMDCGDWGIYFA